MRAARRTRSAIGGVLAAAVAVIGCASDDDASSTTVAATAAVPVTSQATSAPAPTPPGPSTTPALATLTTAVTPVEASTSAATGSGALPVVEIQDVTYDELDELLPPLVPTVSSATHVVELQLRTLEVNADGGNVCISGGDAAPEPDSCVAVAERPGVVAYSDNADTRVYAVLTSDAVAVVFERVGGGLTCFNEPVSSVGPLVLWWCEGQYPPAIIFELASGPRYAVTVG